MGTDDKKRGDLLQLASKAVLRRKQADSLFEQAASSATADSPGASRVWHADAAGSGNGRRHSVLVTVDIQPASKHNSRKRMMLGKHVKYVLSDAAYAFKQMADLQIPNSARIMMRGRVMVSMLLIYASDQPDLDDTIVCDVLQTEFIGPAKNGLVKRPGVIINDRQIVEKHLYKSIVAEHPRAIIQVDELEAWDRTMYLKEYLCEQEGSARADQD